MPKRYRALKTDELISHELDSMTLIYQKASGITHMVADPVPAILSVMGGNAVTVDDIAAKLSKDFELETGVDVTEIVLARLEELQHLGLVERV
ncbi:hypothetical protein MNBD_ALPHA04-406 [hydrothermal vent metagenome]|uniref:HPr-rel-A system PqqD family protein n=1 Tax=hydrothermal vent metagenome TaxID=652676 RepID=A0A3B0SNF8_9ZZZZ